MSQRDTDLDNRSAGLAYWGLVLLIFATSFALSRLPATNHLKCRLSLRRVRRSFRALISRYPQASIRHNWRWARVGPSSNRDASTNAIPEPAPQRLSHPRA